MEPKSSKPLYGQLIIGPPGSGKTTYCTHLAEMLKHVFDRKVVIVNLDPANDILPYQAGIDVQEAVSVPDVMELENLGPNGALMFAVEQLERDMDWLTDKISAVGDGHYFLFDCPGQVELYTHHGAFHRICDTLIKKFDFRLAVVQLIDSYYCSDPGMFISVVLMALSAMLRLGLPHINVLSKLDLIEKLGKVDFNLEFYTDVMDMEYLVARLEDQTFGKKYTRLSKAISEVIQDYSLVSFLPMSVQDRQSIYKIIKTVDKAIGYSMSELEEQKVRATMTNLPSMGEEFDYSLICNMQDKYIKNEEEEENLQCEN